MPLRRNITTGRRAATFAKRTLGSQSGASFALALLLFLVCVLLTSAVIAASSAAVGHRAQLGKMEQRYYSVTSAARLIEELFTNDEVKVSCEKAEDASGSTTWKLAIGDSFTIGASNLTGSTSGATHDLSQDEKKKLTLPELTALYYLQQADANDKVDFPTTWDNLDLSNYEAFKAAQFSLSTNIPTTDSKVPANVNDHTEVSITESFDSYGRLALTVSSAPSEEPTAEVDNAYALTLLFDIDSDTTGSTEDVRIGTIAWKPAGISTGSQGEVTP